jgi:multidrug efflux pump subunit AcrB
MISAIFVDRPRLAVVIALVITIAGALALMFIPVAQFPDIVPPQVQVSANYPGASAAVVEASVAQPIEAQVVGVDKMIYMKSTSGNDGSYNLTVSFRLGSDPDINTNAVNNRVQTALAQLPQEVQQEGLTVQKESSAILQFIALYSENGKQDPLRAEMHAALEPCAEDKYAAFARRATGAQRRWQTAILLSEAKLGGFVEHRSTLCLTAKPRLCAC